VARAFEQPATLALPEPPGAALEGLFIPIEDARAAAVVAAPHPLMGGSMESPVVNEIAWACQQAGVASLRFNWRGVGASSGVPTADLAVADDDYRAAIEFLAETVPGTLVGCGYSFGALAALRAGAHTRLIRRLVLVAPPTDMLDADAVRDFPGQIFMAAGDGDPWVDTGVLAEIAENAVKAHLEVIPGCDHFLGAGLGVLGSALSSWWGRGDG